MVDLDNLKIYPSIDPSGLRQRTRDLPDMLLKSWQQAQAFPLPARWGQSDKVLVGGMGGSAIAGDLLADLASLQQTVPIVVVRDLHLPFALDERSLVIACSYSGNTEETLCLFQQAIRTDAAVIAITSGGLLAQQAAARGIPHLIVDVVGEPRSAVGNNLMFLLNILHRLELVKTEEGEVHAAAEVGRQQVSRLAENVPMMHNPAKQLALELRNSVILVYGGGISSGVARRWKTQFNENAKAWAFCETIPELLHNSVEALGGPPGTGEGRVALLLQPNSGSEGLQRRYHVVADLLQQSGVSYRIIEGEEGPPLAQLTAMLVLGDYVSYYLALLNGVDPSLTPVISLAKERLSALSAEGF